MTDSDHVKVQSMVWKKNSRVMKASVGPRDETISYFVTILCRPYSSEYDIAWSCTGWAWLYALDGLVLRKRCAEQSQAVDYVWSNSRVNSFWSLFVTSHPVRGINLASVQIVHIQQSRTSLAFNQIVKMIHSLPPLSSPMPNDKIRVISLQTLLWSLRNLITKVQFTRSSFSFCYTVHWWVWGLPQLYLGNQIYHKSNSLVTGRVDTIFYSPRDSSATIRKCCFSNLTVCRGEH